MEILGVLAIVLFVLLTAFIFDCKAKIRHRKISKQQLGHWKNQQQSNYYRPPPPQQPYQSPAPTQYQPAPLEYSNLPYMKANLLTNNERLFFNLVKRIAFEKGLYLFIKVRLSDIINVKKEITNKEYYLYFNRIKSKHIDFVITNINTDVLCCIELDDSSHDNYKTRQRDMVKNEALKAAGIPLIRTRSTIGIEQQINQILKQ